MAVIVLSDNDQLGVSPSAHAHFIIQFSFLFCMAGCDFQ